MKKNFSFVPIDRNKINQSIVIHIPGYKDNSRKSFRNKFRLINRNENKKITFDKKINKKEYRKRVTFYSPDIRSFSSEDKLNLHLCLYDTFKKIGESHLGNVHKRSKVVEYIKYDNKDSNNEN